MARIDSHGADGGLRLVALVLLDTLTVAFFASIVAYNARFWPVLFLAVPILVILIRVTAATIRDQQMPPPHLIVDTDSETILLENCRVARSFWSFGRVNHLEFPFSDLIDVHVLTGRGGHKFLTLVTRHGSIEIHDGFSHFPEMLQVFSALKPHLPGASFYHRFGFVYFLLPYVLVGLFFLVLIVFGWI